MNKSIAKLNTHNRFGFHSITNRNQYFWPKNKKLAVYIAINVETFSFGTGYGASFGFSSPQPDVANYAWREYGNRVGIWRILDILEHFELPASLIINAAIYETCPDIVSAIHSRNDEIIAHGYTNSERQDEMDEDTERSLIQRVTAIHCQHDNQPPRGWLSPWISETNVTSDLLHEEGYLYTLNWCHDDQPTWLKTRKGQLLSVPYPQEINDIPSIIARKQSSKDFYEMLLDQYREMLIQSEEQALVMGISIHPYIFGQPHRLRYLRDALDIISKNDRTWFTTPGEIALYCIENELGI